MAGPDAVEPQPRARGDMAREISRELGNIYKEYIGRGPNFARTYVHDDVVVAIFQDTMTPAEQTLKREGRDDTVRHVRHLFQGALRDDAVSTVERITGRRVVAFLSDHEVESDWGRRGLHLRARGRLSGFAFASAG